MFRSLLLSLTLAFGLVACGTTQQDKVASAQITNTSVLQAIGSAASANKITKADANNLLKQVDIAEEGIKVANGLTGQASLDKLAASRAVLTAIQAYLVKQGVK